MSSTIAIFAALLLLAMLVEPLSKNLKLPFSSLLVAIGFVGSEMAVALGYDTGLRWDDFVSIILHLLVPIIIFESAFNANTKVTFDNLPTILYLAMPAMIFASAVTGFLLYFGINDSFGFPIISALLAGVILSATDPVAVVAIFKRLGAPERLNALLEGESLFNDVTAIVLFTLLISIATGVSENVTASSASLFFLRSFLGGVISGLGVGFVGKLICRFSSHHSSQTLVGIIAAVFAFYIAEDLLHFSGVVAVLSAGLLLGNSYRSQKNDGNEFATEFWELNSYIANAILFILVGVTITVSMFTGQWYAILIGIGAATVARTLVVYGLLPAFTLIPVFKKVDSKFKNVLMWGGLRGAVSLSLALSIPVEVEGWYTIQSIVYGVVIFTLFIQAPLIDKLVMKTIK
jgi:Na+:H+ antiporter